MERKNIYEEVKDVLFNNWSGFVISLILIMIMSGIFQYILNILLPTVDNTELDVITSLTQISLLESPSSYYVIKTILGSIFSTMLHGAFSIGILTYIRNMYNKKFSVDLLFSSLSKYAKELFVLSVIMGIITSFLAFMPFIGFILSSVVSIIFAFVFYSIVDADKGDLGSIFRTSVDKTKGRKLDILLIFIKYYLIPFIVLIVGFGGILFYALPNLGEGQVEGIVVLLTLIPLVLLIFAVLVIRANIKANVAMALLYDNVSRDEDYMYEKIYGQERPSEENKPFENRVYRDEDIFRDTDKDYIGRNEENYQDDFVDEEPYRDSYDDNDL